jgi:formylglycine-generating enzyme required for sulfatase activity
MRRFIQPLRLAPVFAGAAVALAAWPLPDEAGRAADVALPKVDPATFKPYVETVPGSDVKFEMVPIPGGEFVMGSPPTEKSRQADEDPAHPVVVRPFWMGKCEVTWDEYDIWWEKHRGNKEQQMKAERMGDQKQIDAVSRPTPPYADETFGHERETHPVLAITHHAAMEYCHWLSEKTGKTYRLPTEAEWEYAARAGSKAAYFFGDDPKRLGDYAWYAANADDTTHKVGSKKPNPWGLCDMYGNVAEWCLDAYRKDYGQVPTARPSLWPVVLPGPERWGHVVRGGSWADEAPALRSAARRISEKSWIRQDPQRPQSIWWLTDADFVGFRVVRPVDEQENLRGLRSKIRWESK